MSHPNIDVGDVIRWLGVPVLILGDIRCEPKWTGGQAAWFARVAYLRTPRYASDAERGKIYERFNIEGKKHWAIALRNVESVLAARLLLGV